MTSEVLLYADRSERGKLRVGDEQRAWFLDQLLTQSFEDMEPGESRDAALITVHGRMQAYLEAIATSEFFLCHYEPELREVVPETLARYVFATRVTLEDVTDEFGLVLVVGSGWDDRTSDLSTNAVVHPTRSLGTGAGYLWVPRDGVRSVIERLADRGFQAAGEDRLEDLRVRNGVPRWGRDMDEKTFPQEAGVDRAAVHYEKGCYLGQEAMAKIHFRGKVNRKLVRLRSQTPLEVGGDVTLDGNKVGRVTSAVDGSGLAMVKHTVQPGATVAVSSGRAEVVA